MPLSPMMDGFVILHRSIMDMEGYIGEPFNRVQCWIDLILLAQWQDTRTFFKRGKKIVLKRGQIAISLRELSERWTLAINTVRSRLADFVADGKIDIQKSNLTNIISVINYDKYQNVDTRTDTQIDTQTDTQTDTRIDTQIDTRILNKDNNIISSSTEEDSENSHEFSAMSSAGAGPMELQFEDLEPPRQTLLEQSAAEKRRSMIFSEIKTLWETLCPSYPKLQKFSDSRKNKIRVRISEMGGDEKALEILKIVFTKLESSDFCKGDNRRGWKASFDWLFSNSNNWVKVYEGTYDPRPAYSAPTFNPQQHTHQNGNFTYNPQNGTYADRSAAAKAVRDAEFAAHIAEKIGGGNSGN